MMTIIVESLKDEKGFKTYKAFNRENEFFVITDSIEASYDILRDVLALVK